MNIEFLKQCKLFEQMSDEEINITIEGLKTVVVPTGKSVIAEHALGDSLFIIVKGSVEINKEIAENDDNMVAQLKVMQHGEFFGEMSLLDNEPRSANVISRDNVELLVIPKERFLNIAYSNPKVMFNLIRTLSWRLRDTNQKFAELMEKLIAQNRLMAIGMAASKIIHDIKTPLTVIVLAAELIENLYPESKEFSKNIVSQTHSIDQMVREILDFAKDKTTPITPQKVNLERFFEDIEATIGQTFSGRNIDFVIKNNVSQEVSFDEPKIRRVLGNLIKNSSEALESKGFIHLDSRMEKDVLCLTVIDNGHGISEHIRANLFSPFLSEGKSSGTGLGLAISKKIISEHKGTIEYEPNVPRGTIFTIRLPQQNTK